MKKLLLLVLTTYLSAQGIDEEALSGIVLEGSMFLGLFISLYVISYFVSRKHAKKFEKDNPVEERRKKNDLRKQHELAMQVRSEQLSQLFADKLINAKELQVLQNNLDFIVQ